MTLQAEFEQVWRDIDDPERRFGKLWHPGSPGHGQPDLVGELGADSMELQRGQEAHRCARDGIRGEDQVVMFATMSARRAAISAPRYNVQLAVVTGQGGVGQPQPSSIASAASRAREPPACQNTMLVGWPVEYAMMCLRLRRLVCERRRIVPPERVPNADGDPA